MLTGEQHPRPTVGAVGAYGVSFVEASKYTDPADPTLADVVVRVESLRGAHRGRDWGGREHGLLRWSSRVHGDGWSALWVSRHPPPAGGDGPVRLRGTLVSDFQAVTSGRVRGRIRRLWTVQARYDRAAVPDNPATWEPIWGSTTLTEVAEQPTITGDEQWPPLPPGVCRAGLLAELDLGDVGDRDADR